jgi:hypothetical protein
MDRYPNGPSWTRLSWTRLDSAVGDPGCRRRNEHSSGVFSRGRSRARQWLRSPFCHVDGAGLAEVAGWLLEQSALFSKEAFAEHVRGPDHAIKAQLRSAIDQQMQTLDRLPASEWLGLREAAAMDISLGAVFSEFEGTDDVLASRGPTWPIILDDGVLVGPLAMPVPASVRSVLFELWGNGSESVVIGGFANHETNTAIRRLVQLGVLRVSTPGETVSAPTPVRPSAEPLVNPIKTSQV